MIQVLNHTEAKDNDRWIASKLDKSIWKFSSQLHKGLNEVWDSDLVNSPIFRTLLIDKVNDEHLDVKASDDSHIVMDIDIKKTITEIDVFISISIDNKNQILYARPEALYRDFSAYVTDEFRQKYPEYVLRCESLFMDFIRIIMTFMIDYKLNHIGIQKHFSCWRNMKTVISYIKEVLL